MLTLALIGPRIFGAFWWLCQPLRWALAFRNFLGGTLWWLWPILVLIFLPWTTLMYVIVCPGGVGGWDCLWLGIMFVIDLASYGAGRKRIPNYVGM